MSRGSDPAKVKQWTQRFERFGKSGQSVTQFCKAEGISTPSFYHWRQKLGRTANGRKEQESIHAPPGIATSCFQTS